MSFTKVFWFFFKSSIFWLVSPLSQTKQVCSRMLPQKVFHNQTILWSVEPKLKTFRISYILAFTFLISRVQFSFHDIWLDMTVPKNLILFTNSTFCPFNLILVWNWWLLVKLTSIAFVFSAKISIFWFIMQLDIEV